MNRIDNALEYVVEILLNQKNAMPENKSHDTQVPIHFEKADIFKVFLASNEYPAYVASEKIISVIPIIFPETYNYQFCTEINPPPPKA